MITVNNLTSAFNTVIRLIVSYSKKFLSHYLYYNNNNINNILCNNLKKIIIGLTIYSKKMVGSRVVLIWKKTHYTCHTLRHSILLKLKISFRYQLIPCFVNHSL